ncbi:MAG: hypothetical protein P8J50_01685 [Acidimicrobiales bacterium]|jgi:aminoglycoside phosphotransferase (APT) family kinase protein|nr:hypothetical protein [Acidimicrobiales bacterium]
MFRDLADLRPGPVGDVLVAAGEAQGRIVDSQVSALSESAGFLGTLAVMDLEWDGSGPARVVAKLPTTIPANQEIVDRFGYDRREIGVYRDLRPWERAPAPRALAHHWDEATGRGWLLLEALGHAAGDGLAGATEEQARAVVATLAQLHAAYWNDPRLDELAWLPESTDPVVAGYGTIFDMVWDLCVAKLDGVDDALGAAAAAGRNWFDVAVDEFSRGDRTLVHGDARVDNFLFGPPHGAVALDFQLTALGRGAYDLAFFCAGSLEPELRRRLEPELLADYRSALGAAGIDVPMDELWRDYRLGHMLNLPNPVSALAVVEPTDERGAAFLRRNAERGLAAVADHVPLLG